MQMMTSNSIRLEYDEFGAANAPAILLIMGLGTQMIAWTVPFCEGIAKQGFRVIRFDNRDVGLSQKFERDPTPSLAKMMVQKKLQFSFEASYSLSDMALDAIGLLDGLNIEKAHIVGASMGGMIAQIIAAEHRKRVLTLTSIMSTSGDPKLPEADPSVIKHLMQKPENRDEQIEHSMKTRLLIGSPMHRHSEAELRELVEAQFSRSHCPRGYVRQIAAIMADGSRVERLKKITSPTLIIHGLADTLIPIACSRDIAKHIDGAKVAWIEGMGHDLPVPLYPKITDLITKHASGE